MEIQIERESDGKRVDIYLFELLNREGIYITRNIVQNFLSKGCKVNGKGCKKSYKLKEGDLFSVDIAYWKELISNLDLSEKILPQKGNLDIRYEDSDLIVLYKPKGLIVHPGVGNVDGTLANHIRHYLESKGEYDKLVERGGIVHRLDKGVSGLMVVAKNKRIQEYLKSLFKNREVIKIYRARVEVVGNGSKYTEFEQNIDIKKYLLKMNISFEPWKEWTNVRGYIGRSRKNRYKMEFRPYEFVGSKYALSYILKSTDEVLIKIETGRMHQIRATLEYFNLHILGDSLYGTTKEDEKRDGMELESVLLGFKSVDGNRLTFRV